MKSNTKGILCAVTSAIVFGFTPVLASWSFDMGSNAMTLTFYRNALVIPAMLIILLIRKVDLRITKSQLIELALISVCFSATTTFFLYASYQYIGVGLATTLHFLYPVFTALIGFIIFKDKLSKDRIVAIILAVLGVAVASGGSNGFTLVGILLAATSGVTFALYLVAIEKSVIKDMDSMKSMMYMCIVITIVMALGDIPRGEIVYMLEPKAFIYTAIVALSNSLVAYVLLIIGIRHIGAANAAIFSTLEPVSGVVCGVIILGESLPLIKFVSCVIILIAVLIPILTDWRKSKY